MAQWDLGAVNGLDIGDRNDPHGGQSRRVWFCHSLWLAAHANLSSLQDQTHVGERHTISMNSPIIKRSVILHAHKTSVSLEQPFWLELKSIAAERKVALHRLISEIDGNRQQGNLSSALRVFVLAKYRPEAVDTKPQHHASDELVRKGPAP
jgi:predicted DNA-binding ribbon-helix-helix protein